MKITQHKLADLLITLENGGRPTGGVGSIASGIPSVGGEHLTADGGFDFSKVKYVPEEYFQNMRRGHIQTDDILIVKDGATTGKISFVTRDFPFKKAAVNEHVFILRVNKEKVLSKFLFYNLFSPPGQKQILANYRGAAIGGINQSFTQNTIVPLPPLPEQERIVRLLDEAESLRATRERANDRMEQFVPALFQEMFGDLSTNEKKWSVTEIGEMCSEIYRYPTFYGFQYVEKGIPVIRIGNILENGMIDPNLSKYVFISEDIAQRFPKTVIELNDIVMAVRGDGSTGKRIGFINSKNLVGANMSPNLLRFKANDITTNAFFLFHLMISREGQKIIESRITRTAKKTITARDLSAIKVPLPPIALQREFAARVGEARGVQSTQGKSAEKIEALYQSMLSRAFAGEL